MKKSFNCASEAAISVIGGKWKMHILCRLHDGVSRFNELKRQIPGISQRMLTQQLKELERDGIVIRMAYPERPPRVAYAMTDFGRTLEPVLDMLYSWGETYQARIARMSRSQVPSKKTLQPA